MTAHKFKYDMLTDIPREHPQVMIKRLYPDATHLTPESMFDCWTFRLDRVPGDLPPYIKEIPNTWMPEELPDGVELCASCKQQPATTELHIGDIQGKPIRVQRVCAGCGYHAYRDGIFKRWVQ